MELVAIVKALNFFYIHMIC